MRTLVTIGLIVLLVGAAIYGGYYATVGQQKNATAASIANPNKPDDLEIIQPALDPVRGKQLTITPALGGTLQVTTNRGLVITLTIPPGALQKAQQVSIVPFLEDGNRSTLDNGVLITPGNLVFTRPVTLSYDLTGTTLKNESPGTLTGSSHVYRLLPKRQSIVPVLIARAIETKTHVPARIISGGAYTLSLISTRGEALSRVVLADKSSRAGTILEAGSYLVGTQRALSEKEKKVAMAAMQLVTGMQDPPAPEQYAALALGNALFQKHNTLPQVAEQPPIPTDPTAETAIMTMATPSAQDISRTNDILNQDGYVVITPANEEDTFNSIIESVQDPTPTPPSYLDVKF